jgi:hypothetical protein
VANKLQDATDVVTRLRNANSQLVQDVDSERASNASGREFLPFLWFLLVLICLLADAGLHTTRDAMTVKLTEK